MTFKKKRKPMSEEQRAAAAERLRLAREKKMKDNPPQYKSIHPSVLERDEDDNLNMKNVRAWIKVQKDMLTAERQNVRNGIKGSIAKVEQIRGYIVSMENYLRTGTWTDMFWGEYQQNPVTPVCITMAYYDCGLPKRNVGTFYRDIARVWTENDDIPYREEVKKEMKKYGR